VDAADHRKRSGVLSSRPERQRLVVTAVCGVAVGVVATFFGPWQLAVLLGWDTVAILLLAWTWAVVVRLDASLTAVIATREDPGRRTSRLLLLAASVISLLSVALVLAKAQSTEGVLGAVMTTSGVVTVAVSWALVHTIFMLRYADLYYSGKPGGVSFNEDEAPDFFDFAYLAFTIGMTFQVSDTDIEHRDIRRTVLGHAIISYLFGAVIVAVTINVVAGLFS
jgi:uncharacterized membrane protein